MCLLLSGADRFNFVMRNRVWITHHLCKNCSDFKLLLEVGNSEYDIGIDDKMFAGPKLSLDSGSAWRQLQRPTTPRQPFIIFFPLQHQRRGHHRYCHHLRSAYKIIFSGPKCIKSSRQSFIHISWTRCSVLSSFLLFVIWILFFSILVHSAQSERRRWNCCGTSFSTKHWSLPLGLSVMIAAIKSGEVKMGESWQWPNLAYYRPVPIHILG